MSTTTITVKGQITIPIQIRNALDLHTGDQVIFLLEGDKAIMYPARRRPLMQLQGAFTPNTPFTNHRTIRETVADERGRELLAENQDE